MNTNSLKSPSITPFSKPVRKALTPSKVTEPVNAYRRDIPYKVRADEKGSMSKYFAPASVDLSFVFLKATKP